MPNIFDKPPDYWDGTDFAEYIMLTDQNYPSAPGKHRTGCSGCGCLTTVIIAIAVIIFMAFAL